MLVRLSDFQRMPTLSDVQVELQSLPAALVCWFRYRGPLGFAGLGVAWLVVIWRASIAGYLWTGFAVLVVVVPIIAAWARRIAKEDRAQLHRYLSPHDVLVCSARMGKELGTVFGSSGEVDGAVDVHLLVRQDGRLQVLFVDADVREVARLATSAGSWRLKSTRRGRVVGVAALSDEESVALRYPRGRLGRHFLNRS